MKIRRRLKVTSIVTREVRFGRGSGERCPVCGAADMLRRDEAVLVARDARTLEQWLSSSAVHRAEPAGRGLMICRESLLRAAGNS